jgi:hypothetical protein
MKKSSPEYVSFKWKIGYVERREPVLFADKKSKIHCHPGQETGSALLIRPRVERSAISPWRLTIQTGAAQMKSRFRDSTGSFASEQSYSARNDRGVAE